MGDPLIIGILRDGAKFHASRGEPGHKEAGIYLTALDEIEKLRRCVERHRENRDRMQFAIDALRNQLHAEEDSDADFDAQVMGLILAVEAAFQPQSQEGNRKEALRRALDLRELMEKDKEDSDAD